MRMTALLLALLPGAAHAHGEALARGAQTADPWPWLAGFALTASAAIYLLAMRRHAGLRPGQMAAFAAGWSAVAVALFSPIGRLAADDFAVHMIQHLLMMLVAPPLLILGQPFRALAAVLPPRAVRVAAAPLRMPPLAAWCVNAAALWIWHVPRLFDAALASDGVHALMHLAFFAGAVLFWWTVFRLRNGMAVLYVLTTLIHAGALAALLTFAPMPLYAGTTLAAQQLGGLLMWVPAGFILLFAGLVAFDRLLGARA